MASITAIENRANHSRKDYTRSLTNVRSFHLKVWGNAESGYYLKVRYTISTVDAKKINQFGGVFTAGVRGMRSHDDF